MGIQINGQTDIVTSTTAGGKVTIPTATFPSVTDLNATGIVTASSFIPTGSSVPANGMYLPTTNTLAWSTGSIERIRINSSGNLGIGTNNPESLFHVNGDTTAIRVTRGNSIGFVYNTGTSLTSTFRVQSNDGATELYTRVAQPILFTTNDAEKSRIDSSGRLLIGISSAPTSGDPQYAKLVVSGNTVSSTGDSFINITRNLAASSISSGSPIGAIFFTENSGGVYAQIQGVCDATGGTNDYPGRISFYTTSDGASSQTERLRIDSSGRVTMPYQPIFQAFGVTGGTFANGSYWIFPSTLVNIGNHYNTSNGVFTSPVAGTYIFWWSFIGNTTNDVYRYYIHRNNGIVGGSGMQLRIDTSATGTEYGANGAQKVALSLNVNDTVRIYFSSDGGNVSYPGTNSPADPYPMFGGHLVG
jgi:hypothetical protein